jgi:pimeloyl-ACP methyl ester carboxylesterase
VTAQGFWRGVAALSLVLAGLAVASAHLTAAEGPRSQEELDALRRSRLTAAGFDLRTLGDGADRLTYYVAGDGPPLLFLHGAGDQAGTWNAVAPAFVGAYRVVAADLPGHGASEPRAGDTLPMATVVAGSERLLAEITRERPAIVVGNSMGAWIATLLALRHPDSVARIVLVDGGALPGDPGSPSLIPTTREEAAKLMAMLRDPASPPIPDWQLDDLVRRAPSGATARMMRDLPGLISHLLYGRLGEITVPADLLWGASDRLMPLAYAERMAAQLPAARLTVIDHCGHVPQLECPERFEEALAAVLAQPPPASTKAAPRTAFVPPEPKAPAESTEPTPAPDPPPTPEEAP